MTFYKTFLVYLIAFCFAAILQTGCSDGGDKEAEAPAEFVPYGDGPKFEEVN